ncbi:MAG: tetratricopeptide repeat protein [Flavobacteriales bacterium]|nr:tetratricopeptide repeat protein [Flavobacteriales bacterium]
MSFKFKYIPPLLILICLSLGMKGQGHYEALFHEANEVYKAGAYDSAKTIYSEIATNGMVSKELFYNLGNAHFKLGNVPASILFYERALRLDPMDEDIQYNLKITNSLITDKIEPVERVFFIEWWHNLAVSLSCTFWAIMFLALLALSATLLTFFFLAKNPKIKQLGLLGGGIVMASAIVVLLLGRTNGTETRKHEAIVFSPSVNVKSEPGLNGVDQFVIHSGIKVEVMDTDGDWSRIRLADGNSGWLQSQSMEEI